MVLAPSRKGIKISFIATTSLGKFNHLCPSEICSHIVAPLRSFSSSAYGPSFIFFKATQQVDLKNSEKKER